MKEKINISTARKRWMILVELKTHIDEDDKDDKNDEDNIKETFKELTNILNSYKVLKLPEYSRLFYYIFVKNVKNPSINIDDVKNNITIEYKDINNHFTERFGAVETSTIERTIDNIFRDSENEETKFKDSLKIFVQYIQKQRISLKFFSDNKIVYERIKDDIKDNLSIFNKTQVLSLFNELLSDDMLSNLKRKDILKHNVIILVEQIYKDIKDKKNEYTNILKINPDELNESLKNIYISYSTFKYKFNQISSTPLSGESISHKQKYINYITNVYNDISTFNNNLDETKTKLTNEIVLNDRLKKFLDIYFNVTIVLIIDYLLSTLDIDFFGQTIGGYNFLGIKAFEQIRRAKKNGIKNNVVIKAFEKIRGAKKNETNNVKKGGVNGNDDKDKDDNEEENQEENQEENKKGSQEGEKTTLNYKYVKASLGFSFWILTYYLMLSYWTKKHSDLEYNKIITIDNTDSLEREVKNLKIATSKLNEVESDNDDNILKPFYHQMIKCIEIYNKCNFIKNKFEAIPFPGSEITTNITMLVICILIITASYYHINPFNSVNTQTEIENIRKEINELGMDSIQKKVVKNNSDSDIIKYLKNEDNDTTNTQEETFEEYIKRLTGLITNLKNKRDEQDNEDTKSTITEDINKKLEFLKKVKEYDKISTQSGGGEDVDLLIQEIHKKKIKLESRIALLKKDSTFITTTMAISIVIFAMYISLKMKLNTDKYTDMLYSGSLFYHSRCI